VIDEAQKNITALSDRVVSLQDILSDKQARGAWGQDRMKTSCATSCRRTFINSRRGSPTTARPIA